MDPTNLNAQRYRIKHPWLGYFLSISRTPWDSYKYSEKWSTEFPGQEIPTFTLFELRRAMDANGYGLMGILVSSYMGLKLEEVKKDEEKKGPSLKLLSK